LGAVEKNVVVIEVLFDCDNDSDDAEEPGDHQLSLFYNKD